MRFTPLRLAPAAAVFEGEEATAEAASHEAPAAEIFVGEGPRPRKGADMHTAEKCGQTHGNLLGYSYSGNISPTRASCLLNAAVT